MEVCNAPANGIGHFIFGLSRHFAYSGIVHSSDGGWVELDIVTGKPKSSQTGQKAQTLKDYGDIDVRGGHGPAQ